MSNEPWWPITFVDDHPTYGRADLMIHGRKVVVAKNPFGNIYWPRYHVMWLDHQKSPLPILTGARSNGVSTIGRCDDLLELRCFLFELASRLPHE